MMLALLAQTMIAIPGSFSGLAVWLVLIVAVCAIVFIATKAMGITIPQWAIQVLTIVFIAIVCIWAIQFLVG